MGNKGHDRKWLEPVVTGWLRTGETLVLGSLMSDSDWEREVLNPRFLYVRPMLGMQTDRSLWA